ncbi:MAG: hypothetical protein LUG60_12700 [Erysipelotrichaceae bacterium]|nr:hypothetical protein [Erysipelotrichaceae bacterium]
MDTRFEDRRSKIIGIGVIVIIVVALIIGISLWFVSGSWPTRFKGELNSFFGEGNWEEISSESYESMMYTVHHYTGDSLYDYDTNGTYTEWDILYNNEEIWTISNHTYKINHSKYNFFSPKRYSAKQALIQQLMNISCTIAAEDVQYNILSEVLNDEQLECLRVNISYHDGNPKPSFYSQLAKEDWFNVNDSTAYNYLKTDLYDFYIDILAFDYKFEKLSDEDQEDLLNSLDDIVQLLEDTYGEYAKYDIYLGEGYSLESGE